ncbi:hypothetical protein Tsubulata_039470 [Turnera subulata]|uniref:DUF4283 domain-containing protein n=1 Tax=Turnera subulata TaxID=218843 RepID=A0A9Q0IZI7_9ROSI|nr:hypothetical protein Tsubulata_039470 [Turnera subulata]
METEKRSEPETFVTGQPPFPDPPDDSTRSAKKSRPNGDEVLPQADEELVDVAPSVPFESACSGDADAPLPQAEPSASQPLHTSAAPPPWSFRDVVSKPADQRDLDDDVEYEDDDIVYVDGEFGMGIELFETFKSRLDKQWQNSVIVKLLGRTIGYKALCGRIQTLWNPRGKYRVIDLLNNYFTVWFELRIDCTHALCDGPWQVYGSALTVQPWSSQFRASENRVARAVVWVRFPDLNPSRFHPRILGVMGSLVGRTVRIDIKTHNAERGQYAKVVVEVDLTRPLRGKIMFETQPYEVSYEGLPTICYGCGCVGHPTKLCPALPSKAPASSGVPSAPVGSSHSAPAPAWKASGEYSEWMVVPRSTGRWTRKNPPATSQANVTAHPQLDTASKNQESRYTILGDQDNDGQHASTSTSTTVGGDLKGKNVIESHETEFPALARPVPKGASLNIGALPSSSVMPQPNQVSLNTTPDVSPSHVSHSVVQLPPTTHSISVADMDKTPSVPSGSIPFTSLSPSPCPIPRPVNGEAHSRPPDLNPSSALAYMPPVKPAGVGHSDGFGFSLKKPVLPAIGLGKTKGSVPSSTVGIPPTTVVPSDDDFNVSLKEYVRLNRPSILLIFEPRISGRRASRIIRGPWVLCGDFNAVMSSMEARGVSPRRGCRRFNGCVDFCNLVNLGFTRPAYTWRRGLKWHVRPESPFKFQAAWLTHEQFRSFISTSWQVDSDAATALSAIRDKLGKWNYEVFGNVFIQKRRLLTRISGIQRILSRQFSSSLASLEIQLRQELNSVLLREELLWYQKSRSRWISQRDRNTHYYHACTIAKRRGSMVRALKDENGLWCTNELELRAMAISFFQKVFTEEQSDCVHDYMAPSGGWAWDRFQRFLPASCCMILASPYLRWIPLLLTQCSGNILRLGSLSRVLLMMLFLQIGNL